MQLREGERILKVYHHHPTPFVFQILKVVGTSLPFYLLLFLFSGALSTKWYVISHLIILFIFSLVITYISIIYWLDRLIITNLRVIHIDWKYLTIRDEAEAFLDDIQDIQTEEKGILAFIGIFDYGLLRLDTASSYVTLTFLDAPNPERIRRFIYHLRTQ